MKQLALGSKTVKVERRKSKRTLQIREIEQKFIRPQIAGRIQAEIRNKTWKVKH